MRSQFFSFLCKISSTGSPCAENASLKLLTMVFRVDWQLLWKSSSISFRPFGKSHWGAMHPGAAVKSLVESFAIDTATSFELSCNFGKVSRRRSNKQSLEYLVVVAKSITLSTNMTDILFVAVCKRKKTRLCENPILETNNKPSV